VSAFFRLLRVPRKVAIGAIAIGLLLGSVLAFGLASSSSSFPFAFSAARVSSPSPTARPQLGNRSVATGPIGSPGCGEAHPVPTGQTTASALNVSGVEREYWLHVPHSYVPDDPTPLVLAFHGHGGTAAPFERYTRLSALADQHGFLIAYPQGALGPDGQTGWDTFRRRDPGTDDVGFVNALLTHLQDTLCVDPARIYATGFSNGGGFVSVLACDLSSRIAAFVPVSGDYFPQPSGCHPSRPVSVLEIHGAADSINPYNGSTQLGYVSVGQWLSDWATRDDCAEKPILRSTGSGIVVESWTECQNGTTIIHDRLVGIGHLWLLGPTLASAGATPGAARAPQVVDFDTDTTIWNFFATQKLPAAPQA
jgi:polyhydroxybutyrate depolymerase